VSYVLSYNNPIRIGTAHHEGRTVRLATALRATGHRPDQTYTIFGGTSEIQRLIIARAISGVHIK